MDNLLALDTQLFFAINHLPHSFVADWLAMLLSGVGTAGFVWICIGILLFLREETKHHRFFIPFLGVLGLSWVVVEQAIKSIVARPRPSIDMGAYIVGDGATWYSFPSSHAALSWAFVVVLSHYEPKYTGAYVVLAILISLSRVYLGVHYPFDILAGAVLGFMIGKVSLRVPSFLLSAPKKSKKRTSRR